jgi:NSS family neurotransmitter:Na+ symporter
MAIFGSYLKKDRSLMGEAINVAVLDTFVAIVSGLIIFPACFTYAGGNVTAGPPLIFDVLPNIFNNLPGGRIIGSLFFMFLAFAALSTIFAVFENIISFWLEMTSIKRPVVCLINIGLLMLLTVPAILSLGVWENIKIMGMGFLDLEDFIVSNLLLPVGSLIYVLFCMSRYGWGWKSFEAEVNEGKGLKFPRWIRPYMTYVLPVIIFGLMVYSIVSKFI